MKPYLTYDQIAYGLPTVFSQEQYLEIKLPQQSFAHLTTILCFYACNFREYSKKGNFPVSLILF